MLETVQIVTRFGQYGLLLGLMGLSAFSLNAASAAALLPLRRLLTAGTFAALAVCALALIGQTGQMTGALADAVRPEMLWTVLGGTHYGVAWAVRLATLLGALVALRWAGPRFASRPLAILFGVAVATLAWGGHGAASEGAAGLLHLTADIVHLWLASLWLGALAAFCLLLVNSSDGAPEQAAKALAGFAGLGSIIAAGVVATGVVNTAFLVPMSAIGQLAQSLWAVLLAIKLVAFAGMLTLAATNRFILTPRLKMSLGDAGAQSRAIRELRISLAIETSLALIVLALVAALGTLPPPGAD